MDSLNNPLPQSKEAWEAAEARKNPVKLIPKDPCEFAENWFRTKATDIEEQALWLGQNLRLLAE